MCDSTVVSMSSYLGCSPDTFIQKCLKDGHSWFFYDGSLDDMLMVAMRDRLEDHFKRYFRIKYNIAVETINNVVVGTPDYLYDPFDKAQELTKMRENFSYQLNEDFIILFPIVKDMYSHLRTVKF